MIFKARSMKNICYKGEKPKYITGFPVKVEEGFYFEENEDKLDYSCTSDTSIDCFRF